jgi:hypothetical protein
MRSLLKVWKELMDKGITLTLGCFLIEQLLLQREGALGECKRIFLT